MLEVFTFFPVLSLLFNIDILYMLLNIKLLILVSYTAKCTLISWTWRHFQHFLVLTFSAKYISHHITKAFHSSKELFRFYQYITCLNYCGEPYIVHRMSHIDLISDLKLYCSILSVWFMCSVFLRNEIGNKFYFYKIIL